MIEGGVNMAKLRGDSDVDRAPRFCGNFFGSSVYV